MIGNVTGIDSSVKAVDNLVQDIGVRRKALSPHCELAIQAQEWVAHSAVAL